jgi:phytoene dehydrogenase-like protein
MTTDTIVIGGGLNGLVTAVSLAQTNKTVTLFEQQAHLGGAAQTGAGDVGLLDMALVERLGLAEAGLVFIEPPALVTALHPDGPALTLWRDEARTVAGLRAFSPQDAGRYPAFCREVAQLGALWQRGLAQPAPDLATADFATLLTWGQTIAGEIDQTQLLQLLHTAALSLRHYLRRWFETDLLHGALAAGPLLGSCYGPWADHTTRHLLAQAGPESVRAVRLVQGGLAQLVGTLAQAAVDQGVEIETETAVTRIILDELAERALGVQVADGRTIQARQIAASCSPRHTFFNLVGPQQLEPRLVRRLRNQGYRGTTAQLKLRLRGLPTFQGVSEPDALTGHIVVAPSLAYLEKAADAGKYGRISPAPVLDMLLPTLSDPALAPAGEHHLYVTIQHTPYRLHQGQWDAAQRAALMAQVMDQLAGYCPGLRDQLLDQQLITPLDFEEQFGLAEGHIHQGQLELGQLWALRPLPGCAPYETPISNLYLCGAGTHPGAIMGASGRLAAQAIGDKVAK